MARLLRHCGLPDAALPQAMRAFERNSQEGTAIARSRRAAAYTEANAARFLATLARRPRINSPHYRLPDIYGPRTSPEPAGANLSPSGHVSGIRVVHALCKQFVHRTKPP